MPDLPTMLVLLLLAGLAIRLVVSADGAIANEVVRVLSDADRELDRHDLTARSPQLAAFVKREGAQRFDDLLTYMVERGMLESRRPFVGANLVYRLPVRTWIGGGRVGVSRG